jgi:hypothetical protein
MTFTTVAVISPVSSGLEANTIFSAVKETRRRGDLPLFQ